MTNVSSYTVQYLHYNNNHGRCFINNEVAEASERQIILPCSVLPPKCHTAFNI